MQFLKLSLPPQMGGMFAAPFAGLPAPQTEMTQEPSPKALALKVRGLMARFKK